MKKTFIYILLCLLLSAPSHGQTAYVSERLYLGLYAEPNANTDPVKTLASGTQVEIVERLGDFVRLRLNDGSEGWARAEFVSQELPAKLLVKELTTERDQLRLQLEKISKQDNGETQQIKRLEQQLASANQQVEGLNRQLAQAKTVDATAEQQQTNQQQVIADLKSQLQASEQSKAALETQLAQVQQAEVKPKQANLTGKIIWFSVSIFAALGIGIILGVRWLSARIRKRFNGLKVW